VLVVALAAWALFPRPTLAAFVACYGAALLLVSGAQALRIAFLPEKLTRLQGMLLFGVATAAPLALAWRERDRIRDAEGLRGIDRLVEDRIRLEHKPSIFPAVVGADQPQRFYVHAPGTREIAMRFANGGAWVTGTSLGQGVFRVEYDPRRDGAPEQSGRITVSADGREVERKLVAAPATPHPRWLSSDPTAGIAAAVSEETDELVLVDREAGLRRIPVGDGPSDCAFVGFGRIAVAHRYTPELWIVEAATGKTLARPVLGHFQHRLAVSPDATALAVAMAGARPGVRFVRLPSGEPDALVRLAFAPDWLAFGADAATLVVAARATRSLHRLLLVAPGEPEPRGALALDTDPPGSPWRIDGRALLLGRPAVTLARAGARIVVATTGFEASGQHVEGNHHVQHHLLTVDPGEWRIEGVRITDRRGTEQDLPLNVEHGAGPSGIAALDDGSLLVAFAGSDEVWRIPPSQHNPRRYALVGHHAPHGVADLGAGRFAVSSPAGGAIAVLGHDGRVVGTARLGAEDDALAESDRASWRRRMGEYAFYEATRTGISCASCHLHADSDGCAHNIGQSVKPVTLGTRGIAASSPYLRDASYPRIRDLHDVSEILYRGYRKQAPLDRGVAIEAWLKSLPPLPHPRTFEPRDLDLERAGLEALVKADCTLCHEPPAFTNLGQHPTRSLFPAYAEKLRRDEFVDVPTLVGLATSAPYLQDGRAATLEDVLRDNERANRHGNTRALSDEERRALLHFLGSL
jgi:hypothetical protein